MILSNEAILLWCETTAKVVGLGIREPPQMGFVCVTAQQLLPTENKLVLTLLGIDLSSSLM